MTCLLIFQGAYAINMQFSASDGGGNSVSISESYNVDNGVEVWGQSSAAFGEGLKIDDRRRFTGPGNIYAVQEYAGSGGYVGMSYIYAEDAAHTLARGSAHLTPGALGVVQDASIRDAGACAVVSTANQGGRGTMQHASVWDGSLDSRQTIGVDGGIATSQDTQMVGDLPTAFGTAGYMDVNLGPSNLKIEGEGAAVAVSSLDLAGPAEVDCNLATGTGNSAWAYGKIRSAESDLGAVGAAAGAGKIDLEADWTGDLPELYIDGYGEAAAAGVGAIGVNNEIRGTLAASTTDAGTSASGREIEASNREGAVVAAAAAGGLGIGVDLQNGFIGGGAEAAGVGVLAEGRRNWIESENLAAGTGFDGTGAYGSGIEAYNRVGTVVAAAAAGGLGAGIDLQDGIIAGDAEAAGIGVGAEGYRNRIRSGTLAAGTGGFGTGAIGEEIEASNKEGVVAAAAAAGGLGGIVDLQSGFIAGGAEAAGIGVGAEGYRNRIRSGTLAAGTGFFGTGALGEDIEASNKEGVVAAVAAAGGLGGGFDFNSGNGIVEAEGAIFGAGAAGAKNEIGVGFVAAAVGNSADVVAIDVNARSTGGAAGTGVAAGNARLQLTGGTPTSVLAEGSAVGAGGSGATAGASADLLMAESGESTSASGENLRLTVIEGDGTIGAISGTYDSSGPDRFASVSGDVTAGSAMIWGDFSTDTSSSASASAENVGAAGTKIYLGSYADDGTAYSEVYTTLGAGGLNFGEMEAYAGDSTQAKLKYKVVGNYQIVAEASSSDPPDFDTDSDAGWAMTIKDVSGEAWTDNTGAHADVI